MTDNDIAARFSVYGKIVDRGAFYVWDRARSSIVHPVNGDCRTPTPWALLTVEEAEAAAERLNLKGPIKCYRPL